MCPFANLSRALGRLPSAFVLLGCVLCVAQSQRAAAADYTWTGTNGATWNTNDTNWTPSALTPWISATGATNTAIFTNTSGSLSISGTNFANRINLTATSGTFQIAGNADALSLTGTTPTIDVASGATLNITARLLGDFTKSGSGTLTLNPSSPVARAGNNTLSGGVLNVNHVQALGTNTTTVGAGTTLNFTFTNNTIIGASLAGSGTINSWVPTSGNSGAAYNFADMSSFTGTWNIGQTGGVGRVQLQGGALNSAATFNVRSNVTLWDSTGTNRGANVILNGGDTAESIGQLRLNNNATWTGAVTIAGAMTGANDAHIGVFGGNATVSGSISGSPTLSLFSTSGQWIALSGSNTHTGDTILSQSSATLRIANANALQSSTLAGDLGAVQFSGITSATFGGLKDSRSLVLTNTTGAAVALTVGTNGQSTTYGGALSGSGKMVKTGTGTLTLTGANTYGNTEITGGALQINTGGSVIAAQSTYVGIVGTGALNINGGTYSNVNVNVGQNGGTGTVNLSSGSFRAQNLTVGGNASAAGTLNLNGGTLGVSGNFNVGSNGTINVNSGGVLSGGSGGNLYAISTNSVVKFNGGTGSASLNLYVGNGGAVDLNGQSIATNTWAYLLTDNAGGVLRNSSTNAATIASNNTIWIRAGTNLTVDAGGGNIQINSLISGFGTTNVSLTKTGSNALILTVSTNDYDGGTTLSAGTLRVGANGALGTGGLTMSNGTVFASDGATARTITNAITMGGNVQLGDATGTGALTLSNIDLGTATRTLTVSNTTTVAGAMTNTGGLAKAGSGTLALTASNTYTGGTTISAGTLELGNGGSVAGNITNNATLSLNRTDSSTLGNAMSGSGQLTKAGTGTVVLTGANTYGNSVINAGTLQFNAGGSQISAFTTWIGSVGTGALNINGGTYSNVNVNVGHNGGTGTLDLNSGSFSAQNLTVGGSASAAGTLNLSGGTLSVSSSFNVGTNGTINVNSGGVLSGGSGGNLYAISTNSVVRFNGGTGSASLNLYVGNGGAVDLNGQSIATNTWAYLVTDNPGGLLRNSSTNAATIASNNTIWIRAGTNLTVDAGGGNITINSTIINTDTAGVIIKTGSNNLILSASNSYTGGTTINAGTLRLDNVNAAGTGTITQSDATSTLQINTTGTVSNAMSVHNIATLSNVTLSGAQTLAAASTVYDVASATTGTVSGTLSGSGGLTKTGSQGVLVLSASNSYTGTTTVSGGRLVVGHGSALGSTAGDTVVASGGQLMLSNVTIGNEALTLSGSGLTSGTSTNGALRAATGTSSTYQGKVTLAANATTFAASTSGLIFDVASGDGVDLGNSTLTIDGAGSHTFSDAIVGSGGIIKTGSGVMTVSGTNNYSGATTISNGTLRAGAAAGGQAFGNLSAVTLAASANNPTALDLNNTSQTIGSLAGGGTNANGGTVTLGSGTLTTGGNNASTSFDGLISGAGGLVKTGTGTQTLTASNTFSGGIILGQGTLRLENANAAGTGMITQSNGASTLQINSTGTVANAMSIFNIQTLQTVTLSGNKTLNNATYMVDEGTTTTESGVLSGTGGITKQGTGTLIVTASNSFTGAVDVQAGLLNLNSATGGAAASAASVAVATNATLLVSVSDQLNNSASVTLSGGTIQRASGVSEVFGSLNLTASSFLDFNGGTAGTISFSGIDYTPSALLVLNIANFNQGSMLVFQTTNNLSMSGFTFSGTGGFGSSSFDGSTFTITAIPEPSTVVAAIGLVGLMLWPMRRRLVEEAKLKLGRLGAGL